MLSANLGRPALRRRREIFDLHLAFWTQVPLAQQQSEDLLAHLGRGKRFRRFSPLRISVRNQNENWLTIIACSDLLASSSVRL